MPFKNYFFVGIQFLLFILWAIDIDALEFNRLEFFQPVFLVFSGIGFSIVLISLLQLNTNLSPFPKPKKNATLVTNGVFKYIRHPIYSGILIFFIFLLAVFRIWL